MHRKGDYSYWPHILSKSSEALYNLRNPVNFPPLPPTVSTPAHLGGKMNKQTPRPYFGERPRREPYRDDPRDPRLRSWSGDERQQKERRPIDRYIPERILDQRRTEGARRRISSDNPGVGSESSGLKELQDEQEKGYSRKLPLRPLSPTTARKVTARMETMSTQPETNGLVIGNDISDPFICSLLDDEWKPCDKTFSGTHRINDFKQHITLTHKNLQPGTFDTVNGRGRFTSSVQRNPPPPPPLDSENTGAGVNTCNSPPLSKSPSTPASLGRSSLKRRQENGTETSNEESPVAKRSRAVQEEQSPDDEFSWNNFFAEFETVSASLGPATHTLEVTQSILPMGEVFGGADSTASSPPPPPPSRDSTPTSRPMPIQNRQTSFIETESPVSTTMQIDNPNTNFQQPSSEITPQMNSTQTLEICTNEPAQSIEPMHQDHRKAIGHTEAIARMHRGGYTPDEIQRAFRKVRNLELSIEIIKNIIQQSGEYPQLSLETGSPATFNITQPSRTTFTQPERQCPHDRQENTIFPSKSDILAWTEPMNEQIEQHQQNELQEKSSSASTATDNASQFLNGLAIIEPITSTARPRSQGAGATASPVEPLPQLDVQSQPPLGSLASNILILLQRLSPEEALNQLEALQVSVPSLIDRQRHIVREIEEEKKKAEEEAKIKEEIAQITKEMGERAKAIKMKQQALARLKLTRSGLQQTAPSATSSKGSTPTAETKLSSGNDSREGSQQRESTKNSVEKSGPEAMSVEQSQVQNEMIQTESQNEGPSLSGSREGSIQALEAMIVEPLQEKTIVSIAIRSHASEPENINTAIEDPTYNGEPESPQKKDTVDENMPTMSTTDEKPILEETIGEAMVIEEPQIQAMDIEEEPFSMIQAASPEDMDKMEEPNLQVVGRGRTPETDIQVVGSGNGMTFSDLPDYTSDRESEQPDSVRVDIPLHERILLDDEIGIDENQSLSTRDSRSPSIERLRSPFQRVSEDPRRRVTFPGSSDDAKVTYPPRSASITGKPTNFTLTDHDGDYNPRTIPLGARISTPPVDRPFTPPNGPRSAGQSYGVVGPIRYLKVSHPSTVLVTNRYPGWSKYFVALGHDGDIDLIDSTQHSSLGSPPLLIKGEYTSTAAINGAWISPGELALVHTDSRRNRRKTEVTVVKYTHRARTRWIKPRVTHLNAWPHGDNEKITALEPLAEGYEGNRVFATGGDKGKLFSWRVADHSSVALNTIHKKFETFKIAALAYLPVPGYLFSAAKRRIIITDINHRDDVQQIQLEYEMNDILSMSHNLDRDNQLTMIVLRHKKTPLALLDRRTGANRGIVGQWEYPSELTGTVLPGWNYSGTWFPNSLHQFALGGQGKVHIWDIRGAVGSTPVTSVDLNLGFRKLISCTRFIGNELVAMTSKELAWAMMENS